MNFVILLLLSFLSLFFVGFRSAEAAVSSIPFQQCDWKNKKYTERLVADSTLNTDSITQAQDCIACATEEKGQGGGQGQDIRQFAMILRDILALPPQCFFASSVRSIIKESGRENYYYCDSPFDKNPKLLPATDPKGKSRTIYPRTPCFKS